MIKIALCDDNQLFLDEMKRKVTHWFQASVANCPAIITEFQDSALLALALEEGRSFDLFILDVEMPRINGLHLARIIRRSGSRGMIIFLTSHNEFAPEGYKVNALRYVSKLELDKQLPEALFAAKKEFDRLDDACLIVQHYNDLNRIPYHDIMYVRHTGRTSEITTFTGEKVQDNRGLKTIFDVLDDKRFMFIERGCFANMQFSLRIRDTYLVLSTGEELQISRKVLPKIRIAIGELWGDR